MMSEPNPFHVLGLPVDADKDAVVRRGHELAEVAEAGERERVGAAVRELIGDPALRRLHALREAPGTRYRDETWADFAHRHRRNPANLKALREAEPLGTADFDHAAMVRLLLDELLVPPPFDAVAGIRRPPVPPNIDPAPLEVADVLFG